MTNLTIYLWTRLDILLTLSILTTCISIVLLGAIVGCTDETPQKDKRRWIRNLSITLILSLLFAVLIPSKKDAAMIYVIPKMAQSETFNEISKNTPEITKLALDALKETLQSMSKKED